MVGGCKKRDYFRSYKFFVQKEKLIRFLYLDIRVDEQKSEL